jgi:hypothetical protein
MTSLKVGGGANYYAGYRGLSRIHLQRTRTVLPTKRRSKVGINIPAALNTAFSEWGNILYNTTIATAIADRLVENSEIFLLGGDSLRKANSKNPNPPAE